MTSRARRIERQLLLSALLTVSLLALGCGHDSPTAPPYQLGRKLRSFHRRRPPLDRFLR